MSTMTEDGISACPRGEERYEYFTPAFARRAGKRYCQYDYRTEGGALFSCVAPTLDKCREKRNEWLKMQMEFVSLESGIEYLKEHSVREGEWSVIP